jgi:hypothetical protein
MVFEHHGTQFVCDCSITYPCLTNTAFIISVEVVVFFGGGGGGGGGSVAAIVPSQLVFVEKKQKGLGC